MVLGRFGWDEVAVVILSAGGRGGETGSAWGFCCEVTEEANDWGGGQARRVGCGKEVGFDVEVGKMGRGGGGLVSGERSRLGEKKDAGDVGGECLSRFLRCFLRKEGIMEDRTRRGETSTKTRRRRRRTG